MDTKVQLPVLSPGQKYHCFIMHTDEDLQFSKDLLSHLENLGFKCIFGKRDFTPGESIVNNIVRAIELSRRIIPVVSKAFLKSDWCIFETIIALERMFASEKVTMIPLLIEEIDITLPPALKHVTYIDMQSEPDFMRKLVQGLQAQDIKMEDLLPAGNVAHGLAWTFYYGYLEIVLPGLEERIKRSEWWNEGSDGETRRMSRKLFLLLPSSCSCPSDLNEVDPEISFVGHIEDLHRDRAGIHGRVYRNSVYKIKNEGQELYFVAEYATVLQTMHQMECGGIAGLNAQAKAHQSSRFRHTLNSILKHPHNSACHETCVMIPYNDTASEGKRAILSQQLIPIIVNEIDKETRCDKLIGEFARVRLNEHMSRGIFSERSEMSLNDK